MGLTRQEHWSGLPLLSPGGLPDTGLKPGSLVLQTILYPQCPLGSRAQSQSPVINVSSFYSYPQRSLFFTGLWQGLKMSDNQQEAVKKKKKNPFSHYTCFLALLPARPITDLWGNEERTWVMKAKLLLSLCAECSSPGSQWGCAEALQRGPQPSVPGGGCRCPHLNSGLPSWLSGKESSCQCRRRRFGPWAGKLHWRRSGSPPQCSCLENPTDRGAWRATAHAVAESEKTKATGHARSLH